MVNKEKNYKNSILIFLLLLLSMVVWGGSWVSAKLLTGQIDHDVLIFWRFFLTFLSFIPIMILKKESFKLNLKSFILLLCCAMLLIIYNKFFFGGLKIGLAGAGGVIVTTLNPLITFVLLLLFFRHKSNIREIIGLILGLLGGAVLLEVWNITLDKLLLGGNLYFLLASFIWAMITILAQKSKKNVTVFTYSFYLYGLSTIIILGLSFDNGILHVFTLSSSFWINIIYLSLFATTFATTVYFYGSMLLGSHRSSSFILLVPINAVFLSFIFLKEVPTLPTVIGGIISMSAVYIINSNRGVEQDKEIKNTM